MTYEQARQLIQQHGSKWPEHIGETETKPQSITIVQPLNRISSFTSPRLNPRQPLNNDDLKRLTPSVFALEPWQQMSNNYRFIPTINVIDALRDTGFLPVSATQSRTRIEGKGEYTKHMIRFRRNSELLNIGDVIPEIGLINSHDGTSSYKLFLGLFRCVCSNQMVVADAELMSIRVTHRGERDLCQQVIDVSGRVINDAPKTLEKVNQWQQIPLIPQEQIAFAASALELNDSALSVQPERLLRPRRHADMPKNDGSRDLWRTFNTVQENLIKGGIMARNNQNRLFHTRAIKSVDRDVKVNRGLWMLAEKMQEIKQG